MRNRKYHLRMFPGASITVCGIIAPISKNATCRSCLRIDGSVPPANYGDLMGYPDRKGRDSLPFSREYEKEWRDMKPSKDISYEEYKKQMVNIQQRAIKIEPSGIKDEPGFSHLVGKTNKIPEMEKKSFTKL